MLASKTGRRIRIEAGPGGVRPGVGIAQPARKARVLQLLIERVDYNGRTDDITIMFHLPDEHANLEPGG